MSTIGGVASFSVKVFCAVIVMVATLWTVWAVGPSVERNWRPVVGKLEILSAVEVEPGVTEIQAQFRKIRDCEYLNVAWYVGDPNGDFRQVRVQTIVDPEMLNEIASPTRPVGTNTAGPWRIAMSLDDLQHNAFAILSHQCHPFWVTRTNFYP